MMEMTNNSFLGPTLPYIYLQCVFSHLPFLVFILSPVLQCFMSRFLLNVRERILVTRFQSSRTNHCRWHKSPLKADAKAGPFRP